MAEIGTGGYLSHLLSDVDPEGQVFVGGHIARNNDRIFQFLHEPCKVEETATKLSQHARHLFDSDFAIAVDAFPDNDTDLLRIAVASDSGVVVTDKPFSGHPSIQLPRAAKQAMNVLRLMLLDAVQ